MKYFTATNTSDGFHTGGGKGLARKYAARAFYFYSGTLHYKLSAKSIPF